MGVPKVSVIIPVYNTEKYLQQCLDSVVGQRLQDIEIICVDDGSTDGSLDILRKYEESDHRVRVVAFERSKSALEARRKGVQLARGEYILFLDADDYLELEACEALYQKATEEQVDILQFSSQVENCANLPERRIEMNQRMLEPFACRLTGRDVFTECFVHKKYGFTLWNKLLRTSLCKEAFSKLRQEYMPKAQDLYTYFAISSMAESYYGWKSIPYHHYCLGRGVTASAEPSLDKFQRYCMQAKVIDALREFCREQQIFDKETAEAIYQFQDRWIYECVLLWLDLSTSKQAAQATEILFHWWDPKAVITKISDKYWYSRDVVAERIRQIPGVDLVEKSVRTVAIYYYHFTIGGVQRVLSLLCPILQEIGYRVVLITDKEPMENDFPLAEGVERLLIQNYQNTNRSNYGGRMNDWERIVDEQKIDLVLYNAWTSPLLLWDMLFLKQRGIPVIIQTHSVFSYDLLHLGKGFGERPKVFALADGIVTLTETDCLFWSAYNQRVWRLPNPVDPILREVPKSDGVAPIITWIGRFSNEKQPWEALNIMQLVVQRCPEAMLYMVGDGANSSLLERYQKIADEKNIGGNVRFWGHQSDVSQFLQKAAVNLITSTFEGYSMVLVEAQAHSVPTVMYRLPYLELCREERGVTGIDTGDRQGAANAIVFLLQNRDAWEEQRQRAEKSFAELAEYDFSSAWRMVLNGSCPDTGMGPAEAETLRTITEHYMTGWKRENQTNRRFSTAVDDEAVQIRASCSYRIGRFITFIPRKIRGVFLCYQEHGWNYTWQRVLVHLGMREDPYK